MGLVSALLLIGAVVLSSVQALREPTQRYGWASLIVYYIYALVNVFPSLTQ